TRLRQIAINATRSLASDAEARGDIAAAIRAARRGVDLARDDETAVQRLLVLLDRAGDRAGAIHLYEELVARLAAEYETTPSPETQAVMQAIRSREVGSLPPAFAQRAGDRISVSANVPLVAATRDGRNAADDHGARAPAAPRTFVRRAWPVVAVAVA